MKKVIAITLCAIMAVSMLVSCKEKETDKGNTPVKSDYTEFKNGKYSQYTVKTDDSEYTVAAVYSKDGDLVRTTKTENGKESVTEYSYNTNKTAVTKTGYDENGEYYSIETIEYDSNGYMTKKVSAVLDGSAETCQYTQKSIGGIVYLEGTKTVGTNTVIGYDEIGYTASGDIQYSTTYDKNHKTTESTTYTYNDNGVMTSSEAVISGEKTEYASDAFGNIISETTTDKDGKVIETTTYKY